MSQPKKLGRFGGFTLLEMLFTIFILGIIVAVATSYVLHYMRKTYDAEAINTAKNFYSVAIAYFSDREPIINIDLNDKSTYPYGFQREDRIICSGGMSYLQNGVINSTATFSHERSINVFTLSDIGKVTKASP